MSGQRLLLLGNSHCFALTQALEAAGETWDGPDVTTLAIGTRIFAGVELHEGALRPTTHAARVRFERWNADPAGLPVTGYDAIAVIGLDFRPILAMAIWREMVWPGLPSLAQVEDIATHPAVLASEATVRDGIETALMRCRAAQVVQMLKPVTDCPIFLIPTPRLNHKAKWSDMPRYRGYGRAIKLGDGAAIDEVWEACARRVSRRIGARYISQPTETVTEDILTKRRFMRSEDVTLDTPQGPRTVPDVSHANAEYGALVLQRLRRKMAQTDAA